jgi:hypothetical protein
VKSPRSTHATLALFGALALLGGLFLATVGIDALQGDGWFQFYADSKTYHDVAHGNLVEIDSWLDAVEVGGNFLGPIAILKLAGENYYLVMLFNVMLLAGSALVIARALQLDSLRYSLVLLANPIVLTSTLSVNKEVIGIATIACLLYAYKNRSRTVWLIGLVVSLLVRWQMTLLVLVLAAVVGRVNPMRSRRALTLLMMLVVLSVLYVSLTDVFQQIRLVLEESAQDYEGSGLFEWLVEKQNAGYYWLIFPLKAAHLLFASGLRLDRLIFPQDFYNDVIQALHSTALLILFVLLLRRHKMRLDNDLIYASLVYLAIFVVSPIYSPRYFLPVYVLWAVAWAARGTGERIFPLPGRSRTKEARRRRAALPSPHRSGAA